MLFQLLKLEQKFETLSQGGKIKFELMKAAEAELRQKFGIISFFKNIDQFKVTKKIILNESQDIMIRNIELPLITNNTTNSNSTMKEIKKAKEEKINKKKEKLMQYVRWTREYFK